MKIPRLLLRLSLGLLLPVSLAFARSEKWTAPDGKTFSGDPVEIIGPFAIFDTGGGVARRVPLHLLGDADAIRFADALAATPQRASDWSKAKEGLGFLLADAGKKAKDKKLVKVDVHGQPEPLLYVIFYADSGVGPSWEFTGGGSQHYNDLKKLYPEGFEFVMVGMKHSVGAQSDMVNGMNLPFWSLAPRDASGFSCATRNCPATPPLAVIATRDGTPLHYAVEKDDLPGFWKDFEELLKFSTNTDPRGWRDRLGYFSKVQPHRFAKASTGPLLIADPFDPAKLASAGVQSFDASVVVNAKGEVARVMLKPGGKYPETLTKDLTAVLKQMMFVGAVKNGQFVDSDFEYHFPAPSL